MFLRHFFFFLSDLPASHEIHQFLENIFLFFVVLFVSYGAILEVYYNFKKSINILKSVQYSEANPTISLLHYEDPSIQIY